VAQGGGARPLRVGATLAGVVLAAVLLFSLGVMTGARVAVRVQEHPAAAPTGGLAPLPEPPAVPAAAVPVPAGSLTFYDRLSGAAPPLPPVQNDEPAERPSGGTAAAPEAPVSPSAAVASPERQEAAPREVAPAAAKAAGGDVGARVRKLMGKGPYAVQVAAMTDRAAATAMAERLRRQGLPAASVAATMKGKTWYRLRVGSFPSREAAARAAGLLHADMGLDAAPVRD
jgi:septal ring-binding cell division protein DamX